MHSITSLRIYFSVPNKVHKYSMAKRTCRFAISENQCCHRQHKRELMRNVFDTTYHKLTESSSSYLASKTAGRVQDFKPLRIFSFDFVAILISTYVLKLQGLHCHSHGMAISDSFICMISYSVIGKFTYKSPRDTHTFQYPKGHYSTEFRADSTQSLEYSYRRNRTTSIAFKIVNFNQRNHKVWKL